MICEIVRICAQTCQYYTLDARLDRVHLSQREFYLVVDKDPTFYELCRRVETDVVFASSYLE